MSGFNLQQTVTFEREVKFSVPTGKGWRLITMTGEFKLVPGDSAISAVRKNRELLEDVLVGARGAANAEGNDATAEEGKPLVINHDIACAAFAKAYVDAINEGVDRKN